MAIEKLTDVDKVTCSMWRDGMGYGGPVLAIEGRGGV